MDFKESKEEYMEEMEKGKGKGKLCNHVIVMKNNFKKILLYIHTELI